MIEFFHKMNGVVHVLLLLRSRKSGNEIEFYVRYALLIEKQGSLEKLIVPNPFSNFQPPPFISRLGSKGCSFQT